MDQGNVLHNLSIAPDQKMARHAQVGDRPEIRMGGRIEAVRKKRVDPLSAELSRWQGDSVNNDQIRAAAFGPFIKIR